MGGRDRLNLDAVLAAELRLFDCCSPADDGAPALNAVAVARKDCLGL